MEKNTRIYDEFLFGILNSTIANFSMNRPKEAVKPTDFMPSEWNKPKPQQSFEEMKAALDTWVAVTKANKVR